MLTISTSLEHRAVGGRQARRNTERGAVRHATSFSVDRSGDRIKTRDGSTGQASALGVLRWMILGKRTLIIGVLVHGLGTTSSFVILHLSDSIGNSGNNKQYELDTEHDSLVSHFRVITRDATPLWLTTHLPGPLP